MNYLGWILIFVIFLSTTCNAARLKLPFCNRNEDCGLLCKNFDSFRCRAGGYSIWNGTCVCEDDPLSAKHFRYSWRSEQTPEAVQKNLSHDTAYRLLRAAGISNYSSGNCINRYRESCTSFDQIVDRTISSVISFKKQTNCGNFVITGGTEVGHDSPNNYSHWNGWKVDVRTTDCLLKWIKANLDKVPPRNDGNIKRERWMSKSGNSYVLEGNHWDITYCNGACKYCTC